MQLPLKLKYRTAKPAGCASKSNTSTPKKKTIWKKLQESAKKREK